MASAYFLKTSNNFTVTVFQQPLGVLCLWKLIVVTIFQVRLEVESQVPDLYTEDCFVVAVIIPPTHTGH